MKRKQAKLSKENITVKAIIREIRLSRVAFEKMRDQGKAYDDILNKVLSADPEAKISDIQKSTNLKPYTFKKLIEVLYQDFLDVIQTNSNLFHFNETECYLSLDGYRGSTGFSCRLPIIPRIGESVDIPFLQSITGYSWFYVSNIDYQFEDNKILVIIYLKQGRYNRHFAYSKDRAVMEGALSTDDEFTKSDYEIEKLLNKLYKR